jgi:hypothetical protein
MVSFFVVAGCASQSEQELARLSARSQTDCGNVLLPFVECPVGTEAAVACFNAELDAGRPVRLRWTRPTREGDPIVTTVFSSGAPAVSEFVDTRADSFGSREVTGRPCARVESVTVEVSGASCAFPRALGCADLP